MTSTERDEEAAAAADAAHYGLVRVTKMSFSDKERYRTEYKRMVPHSLSLTRLLSITCLQGIIIEYEFVDHK